VTGQVRPSADAQVLGKLRSSSAGLCLGDDTDDSVALVTCHEHLYERHLLVELTARGALVRAGRCLEPADSTVAWAACAADSPRQRWWMSDDGRLSPVTAPRQCLAAAAVTAERRLAVLRDCADNADATQRWNFVNF